MAEPVGEVLHLGRIAAAAGEAGRAEGLGMSLDSGLAGVTWGLTGGKKE